MIGSSKSVWGFDPRTIPGCQLWLDAADTTTISPSAGGTLTSWTDKSGTGKTITINSAPSYSTTGFNGSYPCMTFTSGNNLTLTIPSVGTGDIAVFAVWTQTTANTQHNVFSIGTPGGGSETAVGWNNGEGRYKFYRFSGSQSVNTAATNNVNVIGSALQVSGLRTLHINGIAPSGTGTESYNQTNTTAFIGGGTFPLVGQLAEVIFYIGTVTTAQQQQIEGYLAHKWGLVPYYDSSIPLTIPGCQLWLDAADSSTVSGTSTVTQWRDKSGNGRNTTTTGTVSYANSGISITSSSSYLTGSFGSPDYTGSTVTCFLIASMSSSSGSVARFLSLGKVGTQDWDNLASITLGRGGGLLIRPYRTVPTSSPPSIPAYDTRFLATWGQTSSSLFNSINGGALSTASLSGAFAINAYRIGNDLLSDDVNEQLNGVINEIIVYFSELTTTQRQTIEGYLARKWGFTSMYSSVPSIHPFSSIRPHLRAFHPTDIDGCQLWLDAADASTVTLSGSNVTQWSDKSGTGNNATAGGTAPTYSSATRSIVFGGAGYFTNSSLSLPLSTRSVFIVCRQTSRAAEFEGIMLLSSPSVSETDYDSSTTIPYFASGSNPTVGDTAFSIYNRGNYVQNYRPYVLTPLGIYVDVFGSSSGTLYVNGTSNSTDADSSGLGTANGYILGARKFPGTTLSTFLNGSINEILVYNIAVTNSQRQTIEGYLAHKWGLTPSLPVISPLSIPGCAMWFDAADSNTITLSSGSLTQWNDKSGNGRNLTAVSGYANATVSSAFQNGLNVFNFSGNGLYRAAANSAVYPLDAYIIVALKSLTAQSDVLSIGPTNADNFNSLIFSEGTQSRWKNGSSYGVRNVFSTTDETSTGFLLIQWSIANNNYLLRRNGTLLAQSSSFTYSLPGGSIFQVGFRHTDITAANFSGYIGEIVVFNNQLGDAQRQQVEGYLARKWGITISATLPSLHPFKSIPPATSAHFSPTSITGCQMWLDGSDSSTVTFSSGSNVNQWSDKSGNGRNATVYNGTPTYTVSSGMTFNGSSSLQVSYPASPTVESLFVIVKFNSVSAQGDLFSGTSTGQREFLMYSPYSPGTMYLGRYGFAPSGSINGGTVTTGTTYMLNYVFNGTGNTISFFQSGNTIISGTPQFTYSSGGTISLIGSYGGGGFLQGQVYEMIVYNTAVTTSQRQKIEGYLAHKWGLTSSVPSKHPYRPLPPIFPPNLFIPTPSMYSALFNNIGVNSFLSIPANSALTLGTNNHTIEFWMYQTVRNQYDCPFIYGNTAYFGTNNYYMDTGYTSFGFLIGNGSGNWAVYVNGGTAPSLNAWHHYAIVRNGNTFTLYADGTSRGSQTSSVNITAQGDVFKIGNHSSYGVNGYITNFRVVNGTAVYTSNFTPPTSPLTAIPNTQMLIQGLVDNSPNAFTVTNNAGVTLSTTVTPF